MRHGTRSAPAHDMGTRGRGKLHQSNLLIASVLSLGASLGTGIDLDHGTGASLSGFHEPVSWHFYQGAFL